MIILVPPLKYVAVRGEGTVPLTEASPFPHPLRLYPRVRPQSFTGEDITPAQVSYIEGPSGRKDENVVLTP